MTLITVADQNFLGKAQAYIMWLGDELPSVTSKMSDIDTTVILNIDYKL